MTLAEQRPARFDEPLAVVRGCVVEGDRRGRQLGFPTANLVLDDDMPVPDGVYSGNVTLPDGTTHPAAISIGRRPTFYLTRGARLLEAHLVDFRGDLYSQSVTVEVVHHVRDQMRFETVDHLVAQLRRDVAAVRTAADLADPNHLSHALKGTSTCLTLLT